MPVRKAPITAQDAASIVADEVMTLDEQHLARLAPEQQDAHLAARELLYKYFRDIWDSAKRDGHHPGDNLEWSGVAGMCDLLMSLSTTAGEVTRQHPAAG